MKHDADVVVAGGGPVGLMLACELALADVSVVVLERLTEVDTTIKAGAINTPSSEAFYRRGMLPGLAEVQRAAMAQFSSFMRQREAADASTVKAAPRFAGHFAGIMLRADLLDESDPEFGTSGPATEVGLVPQEALERLLAARAAELGVSLRRGVTLTGLDADDAGVHVHTSEGSLRAGWLVGCDGGRSTVRRLAGFPFPGTDPEITGHQAVVEMTGADALGAGWTWTDTGTYVHGPTTGRILTVEFDGPPTDRDAPITAEELQTSLRRVSGVPDVTITKVLTATRFTDNARQVPDYRRGRVLLAGDAAHVHSPFGGQGLNLGIGDAMNLGWKLAATVRGWAPEGLLDSYTAERHPIGAWVLEWTRAQVALMRPESHAGALRKVIAELSGTSDATTFFVKKISGVWQRYDLPGSHPLTGRSAPDLELSDGHRLADHLHGGQGLLLDLADDPALRERAAGHEDRVRVLTVACPERPDLAGLLVRPDGCTAWAADTPGAYEELDAALGQWFGSPAAVPA
ncbi:MULTISPECIES: FAD-dependent oxidoreductase [unclassified Streptomyces]|uniref:FAD-dependent oxidoreductase n=1 Tax=unclassified Streptomyces TaxID=2593676 RepID=UPI0003A03B53|nr:MULTISPECIES: FAD-dependent oxidoreductase [unclassified Streptomyces]MYT27956.1 FAD-dependent oxidoreductase [Streptomyces sp. SID8354]